MVIADNLRSVLVKINTEFTCRPCNGQVFFPGCRIISFRLGESAACDSLFRRSVNACPTSASVKFCGNIRVVESVMRYVKLSNNKMLLHRLVTCSIQHPWKGEP